jgi:hypothetical protein
MGFAFHEGGFTSGLQAAKRLGGVTLPFEISPSPNRRINHVWIADAFEFLEKLLTIRLFLVSSRLHKAFWTQRLPFTKLSFLCS